ncbi:hypothetical protein CNMCM8057_001043 [Aspergillus fumigatus]|nr:hypothetical protein CNMCM8057_001043 [Aspergillus fumigatus]
MSLGLIICFPFPWGAITPLQDPGLRKLDSLGIRVIAILGLDFFPVIVFVLVPRIILARPSLLRAALRGSVCVATVIVTPLQNQFNDFRSRRLQSPVVVLHQALLYLKSPGNVPSQALLVGFMDEEKDEEEDEEEGDGGEAKSIELSREAAIPQPRYGESRWRVWM